MVILDAPAFKPVLTPEVALGIVQKEIRKRGWKNFDVSAIKLVFTPFYSFSFDVLAEGAGAPSAKAALNANNGELNELVPFMLDRPLDRVRETEDNAEVEATTIPAEEVKTIAAIKVAASVGTKKDSVVVSAVSKLYAASYKIWVNVADDTFKIEIDASLGAPKGFEAIPKREKKWEEVTEETLVSMKSPKGWFDLFGQLIKGVPDILSAKGGPVQALISTPAGRAIILVAVVLALAYFAFLAPRTGNTCVADDGFPLVIRNTMWLNGTCTINNPGNKEEMFTIAVYALEDGKDTSYRTLLTGTVKPGIPLVRQFSLSWNASQTPSGAIYTVGNRKLG